MARFAAVFIALASVLSLATATPIANNATLDKRASTHTGRGTWFNVGLGACGYTDEDSDSIVALSTNIYDSGSHCNKWLTIKNKANGKTAKGQVRDACPGCSSNDIDMSPTLFKKLGSLDTGVLTVEWSYTS
ncbi:hypothetical protein QCA50_007043 [Cerrena zonata]|uniref:RlpA-like double-psi beta-barrel-protein domain-containing protein-containing protein n=1 Tax=Cerrena zonata TaxID=2478898 RepID=A0AAW0GML5_9APHY